MRLAMKHLRYWGPGSASIVLLIAALVAAVPGDLAEDDPVLRSLYASYEFRGYPSHAPLPPSQAKENLLRLIRQAPDRSELYRKLADVEVQLLNFDKAESAMRTYLEKSSDQEQAYADLAAYYHSRLEFQKELRALEEYAQSLHPSENDVDSTGGRYAVYHRILDLIPRYGLRENPADYYRRMLESYPDQKQPYLEFIEYSKELDREIASEILEQLHTRFPEDDWTYLQTRASLLEAEEAFQLLDDAYDPLWDLELVRSLDKLARAAGKYSEYIRNLQDQIQNHPEDFDTVSRIFYAFYLQGNLLEAQNTLSDFRLQKEKLVSERRDVWQTPDLHGMARLSELILQHNDAARYYYSLFSRLRYEPDEKLFPDDALFGIYRILLAAGNRPVQIGAGNLDYYKDIASADTNPGILNGILSLILNGSDPVEEFRLQQEKALGYFNRAEALRLLRYTQRFYPSSSHLPDMYTRSLQVYEQYGMDELVVRTGEDFIRQFPDSDQVLSAGIAIADAYSRLKQYDREWKTYEMLLPVAASRNSGPLLSSSTAFRGRIQRYTYDEDDERHPIRKSYRQQSDDQIITYESILNRYIASLTARKNYVEVVRMYRDQIEAHPSEEGLYERFSDYLEQNRLFEEEQQTYRQAINRFQGMSWYERLARFYLRQRREKELEALTLEVLQLFKGTEVESYFDRVFSNIGAFRQLYISLNLHAHDRFPLNLAFAQNLLRHYHSVNAWDHWEALAARYYFLDESIRNQYLTRLARTKRLPAAEHPNEGTHPIDARFAADIHIWNSHFEEAVPILDSLSKEHTSDLPLNVLLADLKRSLGTQNPKNYIESARIREHLANIDPSNASLWITAGETLAEIEDYSGAGDYWNQILKAHPLNPDSYLDVATIQWDYYLFDEALATIEKIRKLRNDPTLMAFEVGAIHESAGHPEKALEEYAANLTSGSARQRLSQLYKRKRWKTKIQEVLEELLQNQAQDESLWTEIIRFYSAERDKELTRKYLQSALETLPAKAFVKAANLLLETARDSGFPDLEEKLFFRRIDATTSDADRLQRTVDLARFYEGQKDIRKAERVYMTLYRQNPRSAGIIEELTTFYRRSEQFEKGFRIYDEALPHANILFRKKFLTEMVARYRELKDYDNALENARKLLLLDPLYPPYFQLVAAVLAEKNDFPTLTEHYRTGLEAVSRSQWTDEQKKARTAELRRGMIHALSILQDYTSALDQYIEMINRDAENEDLLREAVLFASRHNRTDRLLDYYRKTAAASPRDHRWPMILGKIDLFNGAFDTAASSFQTAIEIRPERVDLREWLADCYRRLGKYEEAIRVYDELYILTFKDGKWNVAAAELHARLGRKEKAVELFAGSLNGMSRFQKEFVLCRKALQWGWPEEAVRRGQSALELYWKDLSLTLESEDISAYLEAIIQTEKRSEAFPVLNSLLDKIETALQAATFHAEQLRSTRYILNDVFARAFPRLVQTYFIAEDFDLLEAQLLTSLSQKSDREVASLIQSRYLGMVRTAAMGPAEEKLLRRLNESAIRTSTSHGDTAWNQHRRWRYELREFYLKRHAFRKCAEWLENVWQRTQRKDSYYSDLIEIAEAYRLALMQEKEIETLRNYYAYGLKKTLKAEPVERYLDLLYSLEKTPEIHEAASIANLISVNYFVKRGDSQSSQTAIKSLYKTNQKKLEPVWQTINTAMLGWQFHQRSAERDGLFTTALDLYPVEDLLKQTAESHASLEGDLWFYFATRYGEYLWWGEDRHQASFFLVADLEGAPTSAPRQSSLASFYLQQQEWPSALNHVRLARQLDPDHLQWIDLEARALAEMGRKDEAVQLWRSMPDLVAADQKATAWRFVLQASTDFSFFAEIRTEVDEFLTDSISRTGETGMYYVLNGYFKALNPQEQAEASRKFVLLSPSPGSFGNSLLNYSLHEEAVIQVFETVSDYWLDRLSTAAGRERESVLKQAIIWDFRYVDNLLEYGRIDSALNFVADLKEQVRNEDISDKRLEEIDLLLISVLLRGGRMDQAMKELRHFTSVSVASGENRWERLRRASTLLDSEGFSESARDFRKQMYEEQLAAGGTGQSTYVGLASLLLEEKKLNEAKALLQKLIFLNGENLSALDATAELMESMELYEDAVRYRKELGRREPWNDRNKAKLSQNLQATGQTDESARIATEVLATNQATSEDRALAATVFGAASKESSDTTGETLRIISMSRGHSIAQAAPYDHRYRLELLKKTPYDMAYLKAELFLLPNDLNLQKEIFSVYVRDSRCDQALQIADPRNERREHYYKPDHHATFREAEGEPEWEYDYRYTRDYSIERWKLSDEMTSTLARQAAECSQLTGDAQGQIFFLKMARFHSKDRNEEARLDSEIKLVERRMEEEREQENRRFKIQLNLGRAS